MRINNFLQSNPKIKKLIGIFLIVLGLLIHLVPFVPAGWIIVVGLEILGVRMLLQKRIKNWLSGLKLAK